MQKKASTVRGRVLALLVASVCVAALCGFPFSPEAFSFGLTKWEAGTCTNVECKDSDVEEGHSEYFYRQAAGHPDFGITDFRFATTENGILKAQVPIGHVKDVRVDLPPGLAVNPEATEVKCTEAELNSNKEACPPESQVGVDEATGTATVIVKATIEEEFPVYNMERKPGEPARFGVEVNSAKLRLAGLKPTDIYLEGGISWHKETATAESSGVPTGDYHEYFKIKEIATEPELVESKLVFWGIPEEHTHLGKAASFITLPSTCAEKPVTYLHVDSWEEPGHWLAAANETPVTATGCSSLAFQPSFALAPETTQSDQPDGALTTLHVPQYTDDPSRPNSPDVQQAQITLPEGMTLNPSAANGLEACSQEQYEGRNCPAGSEVGTFGVNAPGIPDGSLTGHVYVGTPEPGATAASGGEYRIFLLGEAPQYGVGLQLEGRVSANESSGQLTATFAGAPQVPFEDLAIKFKSGPRAPLANPLACGPVAPAAAITPYGGEPAASAAASGFTVDANGAGEGCASPLGFSLTQSLAPASPANAGAYDQATFSLTRPGGQQYLSKISTTLPEGLLGAIPSVTLCGEAQAKAGSCSSASEIGTVTVAAGAGGEPYTLTGKAYLTGPYDGAPYGMSVVVPAIAGPYDLGTVLTRATLAVGTYDGRVTATATLPSVVGGVPLRLQSLQVHVSRSSFLFNPTSCGELETESTLGSLEGATQSLSTPFQVGDCGALAFKPSFKASTAAKPTRPKGASIQVKITQPAHEANLRYVQLQLPKQLVARLSTLQKACLAATFEKGPPPGECASSSEVGTVSVSTPVLPDPLTGEAYFVSYGAEAFPDLDLVLHGDNGLEVVLQGKTHIAHSSVTTSTFEDIPDVPVSSVTVTLPVGPNSALAANGRLCNAALVAPTTLIAQSGAKIAQNTKLTVSGCAIELRSHRLRGRRMVLRIWTPEAGRLTIAGKGVHKKTVRLRKAGTAKVSVRLTARGLAAAHARRRRARKLKLRLGFAPRAGHNRSALSPMLRFAARRRRRRHRRR
ncbi:MAG TPA: hypothetical protein VL979_03090 [Solirubrobacteraceae bacterium]|nr:hypothetical protein [Solirubrobacteraceae bacterium]